MGMQTMNAINRAVQAQSAGGDLQAMAGAISKLNQDQLAFMRLKGDMMKDSKLMKMRERAFEMQQRVAERGLLREDIDFLLKMDKIMTKMAVQSAIGNGEDPMQAIRQVRGLFGGEIMTLMSGAGRYSASFAANVNAAMGAISKPATEAAGVPGKDATGKPRVSTAGQQLPPVMDETDLAQAGEAESILAGAVEGAKGAVPGYGLPFATGAAQDLFGAGITDPFGAQEPALATAVTKLLGVRDNLNRKMSAAVTPRRKAQIGKVIEQINKRIATPQEILDASREARTGGALDAASRSHRHRANKAWRRFAGTLPYDNLTAPMSAARGAGTFLEYMPGVGTGIALGKRATSKWMPTSAGETPLPLTAYQRQLRGFSGLPELKQKLPLMGEQGRMKMNQQMMQDVAQAVEEGYGY